MGCRCFWDADTDNYAEDTYRNVSLTLGAFSFCATPSTQLCTPSAGFIVLRGGRLWHFLVLVWVVPGRGWQVWPALHEADHQMRSALVYAFDWPWG